MSRALLQGLSSAQHQFYFSSDEEQTASTIPSPHFDSEQLITERVEKQPCNFNQYESKATFKIILVGEMASGKSSLLLRYSDNKFIDHYQGTIAMDFKFLTMRVDKQIYKFQLMDTAGQERFHSIQQGYYRNSQGCLAVYAIDDRKSFMAVEENINNFLNFCGWKEDEKKNIVLVGNKVDLGEDKRQVTFEEAERLAKRLQLAGVYETSAKAGKNIDIVFHQAIVNCIDNYNKKKSQEDVSVSKSKSRRGVLTRSLSSSENSFYESNLQSQVYQETKKGPRQEVTVNPLQGIQIKKVVRKKKVNMQTTRNKNSCCN